MTEEIDLGDIQLVKQIFTAEFVCLVNACQDIIDGKNEQNQNEELYEKLANVLNESEHTHGIVTMAILLIEIFDKNPQLRKAFDKIRKEFADGNVNRN